MLSELRNSLSIIKLAKHCDHLRDRNNAAGIGDDAAGIVANMIPW